MGRLKNKVAIVTGAGSGMGQATAIQMAQEGATVVITDVREEPALQTAAKIEEAGGNYYTFIGDISKKDDVKRGVQETIDRFGQIDIVVNNAGIPMSFTPIEEVHEDFWDKQININAKSVFLTCKYVIPHMKSQKSGSIINIASIATKRVRPGLTAYAAAKGAMILLSQTLAIEVASYGIRVNVINPGPAETPMLEGFFASMDPVEGRKLFEDSVPIGRLCEPEDIANMSVYLSSDEASFITGAVYDVDGGRGL